MRRSRAIVQDVLAGGEPVYGLTTGVGERKAYLLDPAERQRFNHRLVLNHRIAQGDVAPADVVRGAMLCLANSYAKGVTGVRPELAEMIVALLNEGFAPPVRGWLDRPGGPGPDGRPCSWPYYPHRLRGGRERRARPGQQQRVHHGLGLPGHRRRGGPAGGVRRGGRARPGGVRRQRGLPAPGHRADQAVPRPGRHAAPAAAAAGGQLPVAAGRGQVPAGSADFPLPAADPRRRQGRARLRHEHPADRAQLLAVQPGRGARRKGPDEP